MQTSDQSISEFQPGKNSNFSSDALQEHPAMALLVDVMSPQQKKRLALLVSSWALTLLYFWCWWFQHEHVNHLLGMGINSFLLAWNTMLPAYYFFFVFRMKRPNPSVSIPRDWRVAMVVTKAPSEPWPVVQKTLEAMIAQDYPHDNWLADEDPQPETITWCQANDVFISSRQGVEEYHRNSWPRRTKCKEGNLAYFYDHYGYERYDVVAQLDADHVPEAGYLKAMIRPFVDPTVGYVAAPSICDANAEESWVVRARLYAEATMHGSLQAGYNSGWAPLCIGSHYAVRTAAVEDIGGLGPELAEDHSTTLMMNAHGWRGIFAFDAEAHGDGPACFSDFLTQEFQWSRSLTAVLLMVTPRYWKGLKPHLKFQFLFSQLWYPIFGFSILLGVCLPALALVFDHAWVNVSYVGFIVRYTLLNLACVLPIVWISRQGWLRPVNAKVLSWEVMMFQLARWPWILAGVCNGIASWAMRKELPFKVTPKGVDGPKPLPFQTLMPYLLLGGLSSAVVFVLNNIQEAQGYYFLSTLTGLFYTVLSVFIIELHLRENRVSYAHYVRPVVLVSICILFVTTALSTKLGDGIWGVFPILEVSLAPSS